ncbi:hypothetical protein K2173_009489 [Erythroxylum novogranatense]|uniref:Uncharacterized protein n=1 Tax=Erythroxylum novogranatense TaxID=1862640 RepID=A0AAV8U4B7_9ROSI|nr:hypothetical protein K2173_009489 [Erythroxylum novogranatense]
MVEGISSFRGPVTSNDWCEKNYVYSSYVAEFFNTMSNITSILLAFVDLINALRQRFEKRFSILHISNIILAVGSLLYHATLQHMQQLGDETPMVWEMLFAFLHPVLLALLKYNADLFSGPCTPVADLLVSIWSCICSYHALVRFGIGFKVHYLILCLLCIPRIYKYYIHTKDRRAKLLARLYLVSVFIASLCWLYDRICCDTIPRWRFNPQGHALWYFFMGFSSYLANTFLMFCRAKQLGWNPKAINFMGVFPYVKVQKPKTQ